MCPSGQRGQTQVLLRKLREFKSHRNHLTFMVRLFCSLSSDGRASVLWAESREFDPPSEHLEQLLEHLVTWCKRIAHLFLTQEISVRFRMRPWKGWGFIYCDTNGLSIMGHSDRINVGSNPSSRTEQLVEQQLCCGLGGYDINLSSLWHGFESRQRNQDGDTAQGAAIRLLYINK